MLYDFFLEEFKKGFKPIFKEAGLVTYIYLGTELILKKNEAEQEYEFLKEYPPEVKDFILNELNKVLKPKYFLATYFVDTEKIITNKGIEIKASVVKNNHLLNIYNFLQIKEIPGLLVRKLDDQYEFRPVLEEEDNGFSLSMKKEEALKYLKKFTPQYIKNNE